jgi:hypothetical protein
MPRHTQDVYEARGLEIARQAVYELIRINWNYELIQSTYLLFRINAGRGLVAASATSEISNTNETFRPLVARNEAALQLLLACHLGKTIMEGPTPSLTSPHQPLSHVLALDR